MVENLRILGALLLGLIGAWITLASALTLLIEGIGNSASIQFLFVYATFTPMLIAGVLSYEFGFTNRARQQKNNGPSLLLLLFCGFMIHLHSRTTTGLFKEPLYALVAIAAGAALLLSSHYFPKVRCSFTGMLGRQAIPLRIATEPEDTSRTSQH